MHILYRLQRLPSDEVDNLMATESPLKGHLINPGGIPFICRPYSWREMPGSFGGVIVELRHTPQDGRVQFLDEAVNVNRSEVPQTRDLKALTQQLAAHEDLVLVPTLSNGISHATPAQ